MTNLIKNHNLQEYRVADLLDGNPDIIFVLESPHTQEVKNHYPVAGKSGKDMSKILFNDEDLKAQAFGKLIYEKQISGFGIINISNIPLQKSAYENQDEPILRDFELIRQNPALRKKECTLNNTIRAMQNDFKKRFEPYKEKKIVLCGAFVQKAFLQLYPHMPERSDKCPWYAKSETILEVPHPSFNNWTKKKYAPKIKELLEFIK